MTIGEMLDAANEGELYWLNCNRWHVITPTELLSSEPRSLTIYLFERRKKCIKKVRK